MCLNLSYDNSVGWFFFSHVLYLLLIFVKLLTCFYCLLAAQSHVFEIDGLIN